MAPSPAFVPKEVAVFIHHVELNRAGWRDKTIQRVVLGAVWLANRPVTAREIEHILSADFRLTVGNATLSSAVNALESQDLLLRLADSSYRIPDRARAALDQEINAADAVAADAEKYFCSLVNTEDVGLEPSQVWTSFQSEFLLPLLQVIGANTYRLIAGEQLNVDKTTSDRFLSQFSDQQRSKMSKVVTRFLDPQNNSVRAHISRLLHARFCIEAVGLPENVISALTSTTSSRARFCIFVDTNFLFSFLGLHDNPSNAAAEELQGLLSHLPKALQVDFYITPRTIQEAKAAISAAKSSVTGLPATQAFTTAAMNSGLSGMNQRFLAERLRRTSRLTPEEWFGPYLSDFVTVAREKGVELFNDRLDGYATRQDVIDDIVAVMKYEEKRPPERRKSYESVEHDMMLWHFVADKRPAYAESPIEATYWILTVDFRMIGFDEHKQRQLRSAVPICLHPTSLIQLLQFWVPRTSDFEEAMLGSLRLPFLFQEFDVEAERISLAILKGLGRFEGTDGLSEAAVTRIVFNEGLRARLRAERPDDEEIELIRDALVNEMGELAAHQAVRASKLEASVRQRDITISELQKEQQKSREENERMLRELQSERQRSRQVEQSLESQAKTINQLQTKWDSLEETRAVRRAYAVYFAVLGMLVVLAVLLSWVLATTLPIASTIGTANTALFIGIPIFVALHLFFEWCMRNNKRVMRIGLFRETRKLRKWLWAVVVCGFVFGVLGNLVANGIQANIDKMQKSTGAEGDSLEEK